MSYFIKVLANKLRIYDGLDNTIQSIAKSVNYNTLKFQIGAYNLNFKDFLELVVLLNKKVSTIPTVDNKSELQNRFAI